jgi:hypothetical protein
VAAERDRLAPEDAASQLADDASYASPFEAMPAGM